MKAECLALWGLLWFACELYLDKIWVCGDSKILIDHLNNKATLNPGTLSYWIERIHALKRSFYTISFTHVYREKNNEADRLSKKGLEGVFREMHYELINSNGSVASGKINII